LKFKVGRRWEDSNGRKDVFSEEKTLRPGPEAERSDGEFLTEGESHPLRLRPP